MSRFVLALLFVLSSCQSGDMSPSRGGAPPNIRVAVEPGDLMTSVRTSPINIVLGLGVVNVPSEYADMMVTRVSIVDAAGAVVDATVRVKPEEEMGDATRRYVELTPSKPLESVWYSVKVDLRDLNLDPATGLVPTSVQGIYVSRFHPDSFPVLRALTTCLTEDEGALIRVEFSEPLKFFPDAANVRESPFGAYFDQTQCDLTPNQVEADSDSTTVYTFQCTNIRSADSVSVTLDRPITSMSGLSARLFANGTKDLITFRLADSFDVGGGCSGYHMP